jgi:phospholipid/cholesterol/gamma-HCH transport system substrate-binding protein
MAVGQARKGRFLWRRELYDNGGLPDGGLKNGSSIEIAGVEIGRVTAIQLANYQAHVVMSIRNGIKLTEDSIASIKTRGLIGEKFLQISPGGSDRIIKPNGKLTEVEPPIDLEELLSKYVFGKV